MTKFTNLNYMIGKEIIRQSRALASKMAERYNLEIVILSFHTDNDDEEVEDESSAACPDCHHPLACIASLQRHRENYCRE